MKIIDREPARDLTGRLLGWTIWVVAALWETDRASFRMDFLQHVGFVLGAEISIDEWNGIWHMHAFQPFVNP